MNGEEGTIERLLCDRSEVQLQKQLDAAQLVNWVHRLAPWEVICHLTFRWEASLESSRRCYEKYMRRRFARVSYFYAVEENPSRDGHHVHALWADCRSVFRKEAWHAWFKQYGRARIEPVRCKADVASYCSKYVTKQLCWWNAGLQWHRVQAMQSVVVATDEQRERDSRLPVPQPEFKFAPNCFNLAAQREDEAVEAAPAIVVGHPEFMFEDSSVWDATGDFGADGTPEILRVR